MVVIADNKTIKNLAKENEIIAGKAQLTWQLVRENDNYNLEDLAKLPINDLNLLIEA